MVQFGGGGIGSAPDSPGHAFPARIPGAPAKETRPGGDEAIRPGSRPYFVRPTTVTVPVALSTLWHEVHAPL